MESPVKNQRNFLALTAIEEFWDGTRKMYFLGEWCRQYSRKAHWEKLDAKVVEPAQFKNKSHYEYHLHAISVYEKLFPVVAERLNKFHQTNHSLKYWRLLVGPFLFWYVQIIYDRFLYLQSAYEENSKLETWGLSRDCYITPLNTNEFVCFSGRLDSYNLQLFTQLLDLKFNPPVLYKKISREKEFAIREINCEKITYKFQTRFILFFLRLINKLKMGKNVGILSGDFSFRELLKLMLNSRLCILPFLPRKPLNRGQALGGVNHSQSIVDLKKRKEIFSFAGDDFLSQLVIDTLPVNMPLVFVECYHEQVKLSKSYFPYSCSVILDEQSGSYDQYKFWIGEQIEKGAKLLGRQHGGGYGMQNGHPAEWMECDVSDFFVSWGWSYSSKVIGAPVVHLSKKLPRYYRNENKTDLNKIMWVATVGGSSYQIGFCNWLLTQEAYLTSQKNFFSFLDKKIAKQIVMRGSPSAYCQEQANDYLEGLQIYIPKNRDDFFSDVDNAKIVVLDHLSTSFLFVLAFNIPTILFWDEKYFPLREEAKPYIEAFKCVGIYYDSPKGAAEQLNKISEDPYPWWNRSDVQLARQQFCDYFVRTSPDFSKEWEEFLMNTYIQNS